MIKIGNVVRFIGPKGEIVEDKVQRIFIREVYLGTKSLKKQAVVLAKHSWIYTDEIIGAKND